MKLKRQNQDIYCHHDSLITIYRYDQVEADEQSVYMKPHVLEKCAICGKLDLRLL